MTISPTKSTRKRQKYPKRYTCINAPYHRTYITEGEDSLGMIELTQQGGLVIHESKMLNPQRTLKRLEKLHSLALRYMVTKRGLKCWMLARVQCVVEVYDE